MRAEGTGGSAKAPKRRQIHPLGRQPRHRSMQLVLQKFRNLFRVWFAGHVVVRLGSVETMETEALIKPISPLVLQSDA